MLIRNRKHSLIIICYYLLYFDLAFVRNSSSTHLVSVNTASARLLFAVRCVSPAAYLINFGRRIVSVNACVYTSFVRVLLSSLLVSSRLSFVVLRAASKDKWWSLFYAFTISCAIVCVAVAVIVTVLRQSKLLGQHRSFRARRMCRLFAFSCLTKKKLDTQRSHTHDKPSTQHTIRSKNNNHFLKFLFVDCVYLSLAAATLMWASVERVLCAFFCCFQLVWRRLHYISYSSHIFTFIVFAFIHQ